MKIVFMGTPDFSVPVLETIIREGYEVVGVVTQPDRPVGRKRILTPTPVKQIAMEHGIPVFQPEKIKEDYDQVLARNPDLIVTAAFGQIIPKILLDAPCSGLGIIKRKPDIRYAKDETAIRDINNIQRKLLKNAINNLKKDGILVYSTCTLTQEENQNMVEYALSLGLQLYANPLDMPACLKPYIKDKLPIQMDSLWRDLENKE